VEPTVQFVDSVMLVAHWNNFQLVDQGGMMMSQHVRAITEQSKLLSQRYPKMIATISVLRRGTPISPKPVREELATMMRETRGLESITAVVLEATGVFASALRTTLKTTVLLSGSRDKLRIVANVDEAVPIVLPLVHTKYGTPVARAELEDIISRMRALYQEKLTAAAHG
jgi:hypothetical protein